MQDDPLYKKMLEKSHIMKQYHQSHRRAPIPQVKKQPTILHKALVTGMLSTLTHIIAYPLDTLKTRKMSKNKVHDVARFQINGVVTLTPYLGFFKGFLSIMIGNMFFLTVGQTYFLPGVVGEGLLKTWVDMSKISSQMGNKQMKTDITKSVLPAASFYAVARDLTSRGSFMLLANRLIAYNKQNLQRDTNLRYHIYFGSAIIATLLSHPFDVVFTKLASQRELRYKGIVGSLKTIVKQQGFGKMYSGLDYRLLYNVISLMVMGNFYDRLMLTALQAF